MEGSFSAYFMASSWFPICLFDPKNEYIQGSWKYAIVIPGK